LASKATTGRLLSSIVRLGPDGSADAPKSIPISKSKASKRRESRSRPQPLEVDTMNPPLKRAAYLSVGPARCKPRSDSIATWRWAAALLAYALMLGGHAPVIGVSSFPV
jgi:hypothetical protein